MRLLRAGGLTVRIAGPPSPKGRGSCGALLRALLIGAALTGPALVSPALAEDGPGGLTVSAVRARPLCLADRISASGTFAARHEVELRPDREGLMVGEVLVEPGDVVIKGQVLAKLVTTQGPSPETVAARAPVEGTLLAVAATVGAYVSPREGEPLFRIAEASQLELKAQVLVSNLQRLRPGHVIGLGDLDGRVGSIDDGVDATTQLGILHLTLDQNPNLRAGMFARADIDVGQQCGLAVPLSALLYGNDGAVVGLVQDDRVVMRAVTTGLLEGNSIAIRDGLVENDLVIARAGTFLREGDHVQAMEMPADGRGSRSAGGDAAPGRP